MHAYEHGRLDLPFVGLCTFGKRPPCLDWDSLDADVAVLGVPYDMGTQYRSGARFGPRAIREAPTLFSFGHGGAYDQRRRPCAKSSSAAPCPSCSAATTP
jgi:agmatinase